MTRMTRMTRTRWSTKRTVNRVHHLLDKMYGFGEYEFHGYTVPGSSYYFYLPNGMTVRVSDHAQHPHGGYSVELGGRKFKADVSISPIEHRVEDLRWAIIEFDNTDNLPHCGRIEDTIFAS